MKDNIAKPLISVYVIYSISTLMNPIIFTLMVTKTAVHEAVISGETLGIVLFNHSPHLFHKKKASKTKKPFQKFVCRFLSQNILNKIMGKLKQNKISHPSGSLILKTSANYLLFKYSSVSYTHRRCRRYSLCRSRWSPYH